MSPKQWRIQGRGAPLVLDQTEARGAEKMFLESSPPLSKGLDDRPTPPPPHHNLSQGVDPALQRS